MHTVHDDESKKRVLGLLEKLPEVREARDLIPVVRQIHDKKSHIMDIASKHGTPFYLIDEQALDNSILSFKKAFSSFLPAYKPFYAMKSNSHPFLLQAVLKHGLGLDVSSGRELILALKAGAKNLLFSGPGKTLEDLELAVDNSELITVNIDSFSELRKLGALANKRKISVRAGVRIFSPVHGEWSKFGIALNDLKAFWDEAQQYKFLKLCGIQFHLSWNRNSSKYLAVIQHLSKYLRENFSSSMLQQIAFIDFGGGFFPNQTEGYYPWTSHYPGSLPTGTIFRMADNYFGVKTQFQHKYFITDSAPLEQFAEDISLALKEHLDPLLNCEYYTEPGRIISNNSMHIVTRVVDVKNPNCVIMDGGVNIIGWEYGEYFYYPLVNLTHPSLKEIDTTLYGPLCTPHDIWGFHCYATKIEEDDLVVVPNQGAYKYVLSQEFIKPIPEVYILPSEI